MRRVRLRRARPRHSLVLATIAAAVVASPFAVVMTGAEPRPTDRHRPVPTTAIDQIGLAQAPAAMLDLAESGLAAAGVRLPEIDPDAALRMGERAVGAAVQHLVRDKPLKMVAFTWERPLDVSMLLRAKQADGAWGNWQKLDPVDSGRPASPEHPMGTEPIWVGDAREVQVAVTDNGLAIPAAEPAGGGLAELVIGSAGSLAKTLATTALSALKATLISPEGLLSLGSSMLTPLLGGPSVVARAQWGADESIRCSSPAYSPTMRGAIVHHTAGSNDYTPQQSIEIVRGIYAYHARSLNWCDIGYNVLVDKYGQIFEGAFGGLDRNVEGTHTGGFNKSTVGVSMIGNLDEVAPTTPMVSSVARFLRWRLGKAGVNPAGPAQLTAEPFSDSKFPAGAVTSLPAISGHRDYNSTTCPGQHGYAALTPIRAMVGGTAAPAPESPAPESPAPPPPAQPPAA
ncbi:N-acetylmuramoyl-L-alanine amidase [Gordonia sp. CPCC 206044]|uniref:peptidoglycan recognition protein family protein n=1 Tax=Gordonia sp. CPCC 206044 TaxID=3140793 RepID=UPI003AF3DD5F